MHGVGEFVGDVFGERHDELTTQRGRDSGEGVDPVPGTAALFETALSHLIPLEPACGRPIREKPVAPGEPNC